MLDVNEAISAAAAAADDVPARSNFPRVTQTELCINLLLFWQRAAVNLFITKTPALSPHAALAKRGEGWLSVVSSTLPAKGSHSQSGSSRDAENSRNLLRAFKSLIPRTLSAPLSGSTTSTAFISTSLLHRKVGAGHGLASGRSQTNQRFHVNNCLLWLFRNRVSHAVKPASDISHRPKGNPEQEIERWREGASRAAGGRADG